MKRCSRCRLWKGPADFGPNRRNRDGYDGYCIPCRRKIRKEHYERSKKKHASKSRKSRYGVSAVQVDIMKREQDGKCAICAKALQSGRGMHVDHDHTSGEVRGLLCNGCNTGLGAFKDDGQRIMNAAMYLRNPRRFARELKLFDEWS